MERQYELRSGRRMIGVRTAPSAQIALLDQVRSMGCRDDEILKLGVDRVAWRGAIFRAVPVAEPDGGRPASI
jgi:hypothetical protein